MFAIQQASVDAFLFLLFIVLVIVGGIRRSRRRAKMTPDQLASDNLREEMVRLRREMSRHR